MFSSVLIKSFLASSSSVGAQFLTATVTWPKVSFRWYQVGTSGDKPMLGTGNVGEAQVTLTRQCPPSVLMATLTKAMDSGGIVMALQTFKCPVPQLGCPYQTMTYFCGSTIADAAGWNRFPILLACWDQEWRRTHALWLWYQFEPSTGICQRLVKFALLQT